MWRDIERTIENLDQGSFLLGFGYGIFTIAALILFVVICKYACGRR